MWSSPSSIIFKILTVILLLYTMIYGMLTSVPELPILNETIRNLFYQVPMWWTMMILFAVSMVNSIMHLFKGDMTHDWKAEEYVRVGLVFGIAGLVTGMFWAKFTWGSYWSFDPIQMGSAITLLIYLAYLILRGSIDNFENRARISAVYNVIGFFIMIPLIWVIPRVADSLHPGKGGNPGFSTYDLDNRMRLIFYPAVIGWLLLGLWISDIKFRYRKIYERIMMDNG